MTTSYTTEYLEDVCTIARGLDRGQIDRMIEILSALRQGKGRLFILGVGGSAGNAGHAVNDFRKICGIEAYAPTDNVSELTARANDEGWPTIFVEWLKISRLTADDVVLIFSVGGGDLERNVSPNLVMALRHAKEIGSKIIGIVGRNGGYTAQVADAAVIVPTVHPDRITPHSEAFQAVVWHLIVSHPAMKAVQTKWESVR
jgi:D-sedoheptulose 7-phosphate isomerase